MLTIEFHIIGVDMANDKLQPYIEMSEQQIRALPPDQLQLIINEIRKYPCPPGRQLPPHLEGLNQIAANEVFERKADGTKYGRNQS